MGAYPIVDVVGGLVVSLAAFQRDVLLLYVCCVLVPLQVPAQARDAVLLLKEWECSTSLSQQAMRILPWSLLSKLPAKLKVEPRNTLGKRTVTEFKKTAEVIQKDTFKTTHKHSPTEATSKHPPIKHQCKPTATYTHNNILDRSHGGWSALGPSSWAGWRPTQAEWFGILAMSGLPLFGKTGSPG